MMLTEAGPSASTTIAKANTLKSAAASGLLYGSLGGEDEDADDDDDANVDSDLKANVQPSNSASTQHSNIQN